MIKFTNHFLSHSSHISRAQGPSVLGARYHIARAQHVSSGQEVPLGQAALEREVSPVLSRPPLLWPAGPQCPVPTPGSPRPPVPRPHAWLSPAPSAPSPRLALPGPQCPVLTPGSPRPPVPRPHAWLSPALLSAPPAARTQSSH